MGAPKLLDKKTINREVANQTKQQIDTGIQLSKKVDAIRESLGEEQQNLDNFRNTTLPLIQQQIDVKLKERDQIERGNILFREERMRLSAPIDLTQAWQQVTEDKASIESWKSRLAEKEVYAIAREADSVQLEKQLTERSSQVIVKESLIAKTIEDTVEKHELASSTLKKAKKEALELVHNAEVRENAVALQEQKMANREVMLAEREVINAEHETDLSNRELALKDRYETFIKAQNYINSQK